MGGGDDVDEISISGRIRRDGGLAVLSEVEAPKRGCNKDRIKDWLRGGEGEHEWLG